MNKTIGKNITARRHQLKMTQEQLAELSNLSVNYISKIERGTTPKISAKTLYQLAKSLNVSMENLLKEKATYKINIGPYQQQLETYLNQYPREEAEQLSKSIQKLLKSQLTK
ncbi:helix-turn-helix domain-containing protein [Ligilactobacillus salivarius]|uniref:Helix-turn-helix transcriptional regulator n=2 Tax=Bacilli TaxID=91061 RepID=A0AAW6Q7E8_9LACO|nr:helix-turn-helix transcriptional regulator [Ligilactobacillus salivarius]MDF4187286.1 helix-turn-helix transcriptional regulator [Ligilactobacillus salivarius]